MWAGDMGGPPETAQAPSPEANLTKSAINAKQITHVQLSESSVADGSISLCLLVEYTHSSAERHTVTWWSLLNHS
ncbi:hypothetical protein E2C01_001973 [Portunus trituberculatus]|uniref:Uncharacterized protein n=1 Tax=Portunus trituberculatus TaxID=210409 RepID=A0A5B7CP34_PORTR|nr:hypothetical protein [Portunus trituberculatus]